MYRTPTLTSTVTIRWDCVELGIERQCDVVVAYTFDGVDDLEVLAAIVGGGVPYGIGPESFDALVDAAAAEAAPVAYGDWLSGQDGSDSY